MALPYLVCQTTVVRILVEKERSLLFEKNHQGDRSFILGDRSSETTKGEIS
jgi:hypothetical protein